jgi:Secretion system C-terminal sorting domain
MNTCLHGDGSVDFVFNNIYLPDSASNEQASHGFLIYNVDLLDNLNHNIVASNYADIYFEENPPITTNTVFNTVFDCNSITGITGSNSFCENDEVTFTAEQDFVESYNWQMNGISYSSSSILNTSSFPSGVQNLEVILTNPICEETRSFVVDIHPLPNLNAGAIVFACDGEELVLNAESDAPVTWSNGMENGTSFTPEENQQLIATSVSAFGCTAIDSMSIEIVALPTTDIVQSGYVLTAPEGCCWQWYLNNISIDGLTGQSITAMAEGVYYVVTTNDEGCNSISESITIVGVENNSRSLVAIYPNPMDQSAIIRLPAGLFELTLLDAQGKLIKNYGRQQNQFIIERSGLPSGKYQLILKDSNQTISVPIILE